MKIQTTKRKVVIKWLSTISKQLAPETYKAYAKYFKPQKEKNEKGEDVWRIGYLQTCTVNHKRRMLRLWDKFGLPGVEAYLSAHEHKLVQRD